MTLYCHSLRSRLLIGLTVSTLSVMAVSGIGLYWLVRSALINEFDEFLSDEIRTLSYLVKMEAGHIQSDMADGEVPAFERSDRPHYYQIWLNDGTAYERSTHLPPNDLPCVAGTFDDPAFHFLALPDGRPGRLVGISFTPIADDSDDNDDDAVSVQDTENNTADDNEAEEVDTPDIAAHSNDRANRMLSANSRITFVLARDTLELNQTLARIKWILLGILASAGALALIVNLPIVRMGLKPLETTSKQIALIESHTLKNRLIVEEAPTEVQDVISCLNGLLTRIEQAFQRERAFSSNVAHELRTPLAGLRSTIEVCLSRPRASDTYRAALTECLHICKQNQVLIENLLSLARIDAGHLTTTLAPAQLGPLLDETWNAIVAEVHAKNVNIRWKVPDDVTIITDRHVLHSMLINIFNNAVSYVNQDGWIAVEITERNGTVDLRISNSGCVLSQDDTIYVVDRFWRGEESRNHTGTHSGLGLALCNEIAQLLHHELTISISGKGIFALQLQFPRNSVTGSGA